jgi:hypothetical protein
VDLLTREGWIEGWRRPDRPRFPSRPVPILPGARDSCSQPGTLPPTPAGSADQGAARLGRSWSLERSGHPGGLARLAPPQPLEGGERALAQRLEGPRRLVAEQARWSGRVGLDPPRGARRGGVHPFQPGRAHGEPRWRCRCLARVTSGSRGPRGSSGSRRRRQRVSAVRRCLAIRTCGIWVPSDGWVSVVGCCRGSRWSGRVSSRPAPVPVRRRSAIGELTLPGEHVGRHRCSAVSRVFRFAAGVLSSQGPGILSIRPDCPLEHDS